MEKDRFTYDEPMFPANEAMHEIESRERLIAQEVPRIAADSEAMKAVLQEFIIRLMFEHGKTWDADFFPMLGSVIVAARKEFTAAPINKGAVCR